MQSVDAINATGRIVTIAGGRIGAVTRPGRCSQMTVIVGTPDTYYNPPPLRKKCSGPCAPGHTCTPLKTATRQVWAVCFRRFNCFGVIIWLPVGIKLLSITDELDCQCKPRCKPIRCFPPRRFNPNTCDCECPPMKCTPPLELDPASCKCRCPKNIACRPPKIPNFTTCECDCPNKCPPDYLQDPISCHCRCPKNVTCNSPQFLNFTTCECQCPNKCPPNFYQDPRTCRCICRKTCPCYAYIDRMRCVCMGDCSRFRTASDCNQIESSRANRDRKCR